MGQLEPIHFDQGGGKTAEVADVRDAAATSIRTTDPIDGWIDRVSGSCNRTDHVVNAPLAQCRSWPLPSRIAGCEADESAGCIRLFRARLLGDSSGNAVPIAIDFCCARICCDDGSTAHSRRPVAGRRSDSNPGEQ
jgi:hypothetical protein